MIVDSSAIVAILLKEPGFGAEHWTLAADAILPYGKGRHHQV